jgi:subtilisin family serine protease
VADELARSGAVVLKSVPRLGASVLQVAEAECESIHLRLEKSGLFRYVEHDRVARAGQIPNDPYFTLQWHLRTIEAAGAWDVSEGSAEVPIAIIDSGVDATHVELASKVLPGWDFICDEPAASDHLGHGTSVAGVAAASTFNAAGVAGVAPRNPILPLVVLDARNSARYSDIARAILYAADQGARVINISVGGPAPSALLQDAANYAWERGAVIFAAAMNGASTDPHYPAACDHVVAVSATDAQERIASFSNWGPWIVLSAPGQSVYTTVEGGRYGYGSGTSFASPVAAGVAALLLSVRPDFDNEDVVEILRETAADLGPPGFDPSYGWGRINARAALETALRR